MEYIGKIGGFSKHIGFLSKIKVLQEFRGRRWPHWSRIFDLNDRKVPFVFLSMQYLNYWNIVQRSKWNVSTFQGMSKPCVMFWMHAYTWTTITFKVTNMNLNWQLGKFDLNFFISKLVTYCLKFHSDLDLQMNDIEMNDLEMTSGHLSVLANLYVKFEILGPSIPKLQQF